MQKTEQMNAKALMIFLNAVLIVDFFRMIIPSSIIVGAIQYVIYIGIALYVCKNIAIIDHFKLRKPVVYVFLLLIFLILLSYAFCSDISQAFGYYIPFVLTRVIPSIYLMNTLNDTLLRYMFLEIKKYRLIWLIYALAGSAWVPANYPNHYSMTYGYNLLLPVCFSMYFFIKYKEIKWGIYGILFIGFMTLFGSRASLLCAIVFFISAYIAVQPQNAHTGKTVRMLILVFLGLIVIINFEQILGILQMLVPNSRTLYLLSNNITFDSGRSEIQDLYLSAIMANPFKFNGLFSDRVYYSKVVHSQFSITNYPHDFLIEILFQYGVPLGIAFLLLFSIKTIKTAHSCLCENQNDDIICLFFALFVSGVVKLFFSASYLTSVEFYLFIGFLIIAPKLKKG